MVVPEFINSLKYFVLICDSVLSNEILKKNSYYFD